MGKLWYRFFKEPYKGNDPYFFNPEEVPGRQKIEDKFDIIQSEMMDIIQSHGQALKPYRFHESSHGQVEWQTLPFFSWGLIFLKNRKLCPKTYRLLSSMKGIVSASLSVVEAGAEVPIHRGDTNAIIRSHLGIIVPGKLPECGFECGGEQRNWEEGRLLSFCDAQPHRAWNKFKQRRYVVIIDEIRPEYLHRQNEICATIITTHLLLAADKLFRFYDKTPGRLLKVLSWPIVLMFRIALPIHRLLN